jgi:hypothetical protein
MKAKSKNTEAISIDAVFQPVGADWTGHPIEKFTNEGATAFCPFIDNIRLAKTICSKKGEGIIHRDVYSKIPAPKGPVDFDTKLDKDINPKNRKYHWVQIGFKSFQCCKFQRDPVSTDDDLCQYHFKKCAVYKENSKK